MRRVEAGETITVTVSGRPAARLVPAERNTWRRFDDLRDLFVGPPDAAWVRDRERVDSAPRDPWP